jgi:hypothetical protein
MTPSSIPRPAPADDDPLARAFSFIRDLASRRYFGQVQLSFQSGTLVNVRTDQSYKLSNLPTGGGPIGISKGTHNGINTR